MKKVAIITDSNSGITQAEAEKMGIFVVPMPFFINEELFFEGISLTQEDFYRKLNDGSDVSTSQPTPGDVMDLWDKVLEEYDEIVHIPMSSGLSNSCETAQALARDYDGKVQVVDNLHISVIQRNSVYNALKLVEAGKDAAEIREILEAEKHENSIYLVVETLKYLKKGGRITPAAAAFGTALNIKPVLTIQGDKLDAFSKVRGKNKAKKVMIDAMHKDLDERFKELWDAGKMKMYAVYAGNEEELQEWLDELHAEFPGVDIQYDCLSLSVACHTGPGILAVAVDKIV